MAPLDLLPTNATRLERAFALSTDLYDRIDAAGIANMRGFKYVNTPAAFYPYIAHEYGLGEISEYFDEYPALIAAGIDWQRVRGTPDAIARALSWISYNETVLEDDKRRRRMWVRYQIGMGKVPTAEDEDPVLYQAERLANLSDPARSYFYRGFQTWDVRALEWGDRRWGRSIWGDCSGVPMPGGVTKWSHGQDYPLPVTATDPFRAALGVLVVDGDDLVWAAVPWAVQGVTWEGVGDVRDFKRYMLAGRPAYVGFFDAGGSPIGYRRAKSPIDVTDEATAADNVKICIAARTDFGDGFGSTAASVAAIFDAAPAGDIPPGRLWLGPDELDFDPDKRSALIPVSVAFRRTVREHVQIIMEF
jgi:P2-related tail formation protein